MNEYQKALNKLKEIEKDYTFSKIGTRFHVNCDKLQELLDLRKPKKLHYEYDGYADGYPVYDMAYCPNCNRFFEVDGEHFKNCPDCTQALDWTMEVVIGVDWSEE